MRIRILSDLHLEFAPFQLVQVYSDVVVLAGDIHTGMNGFKWIRETFSDQQIVYVLGNHEFYGQKLPKLTEEIKAVAAGTNIHVLEKDAVEIGGVVFLGATLWTDFRLNGDAVLAEVTAQTGMTDFRRIRKTPTYRRFRPADARRIHTQSLGWLDQQLEAARGRKVVVVTHHAPSPKSIPPAILERSVESGVCLKLGTVCRCQQRVALDSWPHPSTFRLRHWLDKGDSKSSRLPLRTANRVQRGVGRRNINTSRWPKCLRTARDSIFTGIGVD